MINDSYDCMKDAQLFLFYLSTLNLALKLYLLFPGIFIQTLQLHFMGETFN